jgi:hypothetical protein
MSRIAPAGLLAVIVLLAACAQAPAPLAPASSSPARLSAALASGRSPELATGNHRAFWIWRDDDGGWHVRTTSRRVAHRFQGTIRPSPGAEIVDLKPVNLDPKDRLGLVGRALSLDWHTSRLIDGFDFRVQGDACLEFDLRLDDDGTSRYIYLGRDRTRPDAAHFLLCP